MKKMLQSFIGTFDGLGLRSLKNEDDSRGRAIIASAGAVPFWAILDSDALLSIHQAITLGNRGTALELVFQQAKCWGRLQN